MIEKEKEIMFQCDEVSELLKTHKKFDVILAEVHSRLLFAFGERYRAPVFGKFFDTEMCYNIYTRCQQYNILTLRFNWK